MDDKYIFWTESGYNTFYIKTKIHNLESSDNTEIQLSRYSFGNIKHISSKPYILESSYGDRIMRKINSKYNSIIELIVNKNTRKLGLELLDHKLKTECS